ncbi:DUF4011 domain-containing protein [Cereibacter johrii]|uniref:DUF4011 domain-containing protein n=1 Tax=Cereibacter johrii TaxID=445629 RepID=UPI000DCC8916|nr:DUF4011 domain-containing protein [Cereibacter johrii]RAZ81748.1 helicase [Cereibacter johrii]
MPDTSSFEDTCHDLGEPDLKAVIRSRVEHLRTRLLDSSRRNPLIQVPFRQNSSSLIRFVDELPDALAERLSTQRAMRLVALPPIDEPLPDEETDEFLDALEISRTTDEDHLAASAALDPTDPEYPQKELDLERALKDRVRAELGLPERQTGENPSLEAHARAHGISPSYILPLPSAIHEDGRHDDRDIQTLLLPDRLDQVARALHDRGHGFERETGVNVLHAAFGILEWNEPGSSRTPARSPLLLLEIRMTRKKAPNGAEYHICGENEITLNTTLAQALAAQWGIELPAYDGGSVEDYFTAISEIAPASWYWSLRREALVGVFPSSRIAMYRDLDPEAGTVMESPLIAKMLASVGGEGASYAEIYDTDDPAVESRVPHLVMDADASQFSTLIDVANGANVAIEGPPGSGKSQTIVNLIASAMADGKKVLFVAEKLTALDVVRNRLDAAELGEFILPLQAGHGSRDAVFKSLEDRLAMERPAPGAADAHRTGHRELTRRRSEMRAYLDMLGTRLGRTGLTVHDALGQAIATAQHLDGLPREIRSLRLAGPELIDPETRAEMLGDARMIVDRLNGADRMAALWCLAGKAPLRADEAEAIALELAALGRAMEACRAEAQERSVHLLLPVDPLTADEAPTLAAIAAIAAHADCDLELVDRLLDCDLREAATELCDLRDRIRAAADILRDILTDPAAGDTDSLISEAATLAAKHQGKIDPAALAEAIGRLEVRGATLRRQRDLAAALPARWAESADREGTTLADLRLDASLLLGMPSAILERRQSDTGGTIPAAAREAAAMQRKLFQEIQLIRQALPEAGEHQASEIDAAADSIEQAGLFRALSGQYKRARELYTHDLGGHPKVKRPAIAAELRRYARWAEKRDAFAGDSRLSATLGTLFSGVGSNPDLLEALATFHSATARISQGDERLRYALEAGSLDPLRAFVAEADMPSMTLSRLLQEDERNAAEIAVLREDHRAATALCLSFGGRDWVDAALVARARAARADHAEATSRACSARAADLLAAMPDGNEARSIIRLAELIAGLPDPQKGILLLQAGAGAADIVEDEAISFFDKRRRIAADAASLARELALSGATSAPEPSEEDAPAGLSDLPALHFFARRMDEIQDAAARPEGLVERARLLRAMAALDARGLGGLAHWIQSEDGRTRRDALPMIVEALYARSLTDHMEARFGSLLEARDGADLDRLRREIAAIDRELVRLSRAAVRASMIEKSRPPQGNGIGKVGTYTEMSLIRHELNKVRNRIGVRDLTARAGAALLDLKPCWMMSPLAVAQYLHGQFEFDLVVIDEASQMTPENALGAIMRARQVVVVGDTRQLPPTNFFSRVLDDASEEEDARTDSESILDMANATFTPVRQLRWHYRSRHPALIAISNRMIYDGQLTIFPAARDGDPELGVELVEVEGAYHKGRNIPEARALVAGAIRHMREHPERSLGLATMNKEQTDLILSEFERERARHPHVEAYLEYWAEKDDGLEEFFVKNLETIQGDERDVIMISTVYGPDPETGKTYQRFGPVNSVHGHRRLNVLFSRAKEKIVTYSSMKPTDIQAEGKAHGVAMLRTWLEFSRTGQITGIEGSRGQTDSPFEDFVIAQIEAAGFEAVPQVGASGYRIDIGVRHPDWPYGFILAVECDGAPYHSSRSSRDRDRLRQQVLEGLGWTFHRIWSTDWFRDPRSQVERLRAALGAALERVKAEEIRRQAERARSAERARLAAEKAAQRLPTEDAREEVAADATTSTPNSAPQQDLFDLPGIRVPAGVAGSTFRSAQADNEEGGAADLMTEDASTTQAAQVLEGAASPGSITLSSQAMARIEAWTEDQLYDRVNRSATTRKRALYWLGFLEGIAASDGIEMGEPQALLHEAREADRFFAIEGEESLANGLELALQLENNEMMAGMVRHAEQVRCALGHDAHSEKDSMNTFLGFCAGIVCDGRITTEEARKIRNRMHADPTLAAAPIFKDLRWAVDGALADDVLDGREEEELREWLAALVTDGHADTGVANIGGVTAPTDPIVDPGSLAFTGKSYVLTGKMSIGPRSFIGEELARRGAVLDPRVTERTDFVVVSTTASRHWKTTHFGTKIEAAREKITAGHPMRFVTEHALAKALAGTDP